MRMRLSVVFELLLVFLFLAFASARVIESTKGVKNVAKGNKKTTSLRQGPPNRYCACTSRMCNCCRDFSLPVVPLKGPGCASIMYVHRDTMMVTMSFGDRVLSNTTISGKSPKPICMALPGGISQFCGRIYGISRKGDQFRACLGLELRALDDIEAALRVSCFKFGPKGVRLESAPPVPAGTGSKDPEEDDEDDYDLDDDEDDDIIGFGVDEEDDGASSEDNEVDSDSVDYTGFSVLGEDILGTLFSDDSGSSTKKKKPSKKTAKPQVLIPKVSSTTRRPILPNRRRSTAKPLTLITNRPVFNRLTKRPTISPIRPQIIKKPAVSLINSPQPTIQTTFLSVSPNVVTKNDLDKTIITESPPLTSEIPVTTLRTTTTVNTQENEKFQIHEETLGQETAGTSEEPITFTIPTQKIEVVKNDIKLPQTDLAKLEAVAAIAQQDVTSGVISSSSLMSEKTEKPLEKVTMKYDKITSTYAPETTSSYMPVNTEKISSIKFIPTTVVTSRPSAELVDDMSFDKVTEIKGATSSRPDLVGTKNKITFTQSTEPIQSNENQKEVEEADNEETVISDTIKKNSINKKSNVTVSLKKQPVKKPQKDKEEEEEEEEEGEEEDFLEGVLSDDDDNDNEEAEDSEESSPAQTVTNKNQTNDNEEEEDDENDDDDDEDEDDILGEQVENVQNVKPTKISIKKKPASDDTDNEEEEEEEEEDIIDALGDDDEEESDNEDEDDETEKEKNKRKPTTEATTIKVRKPITQQNVQNHTRKPVTTVTKVSVPTTPEEKETEKVTEKIYIYKEPTEKVTEKTIIYQEPENQIPNKIFIYKKPQNQITQKTTENVVFFKEPIQQSITEKFIIYQEPEDKITKKPIAVVSDFIKSNEEIKHDSSEEEKVENDDETSTEEELEDDYSSKHTLVASIVKPGFSNKYAEEHDLTENDDLGIEDSEDDGGDFEEYRKMEENRKKPNLKSPVNKKPDAQVSKPKVLTLSDLIGKRKKYYENSKDDKPISMSRTHRRMNLDRLFQVQ